MDNLYYNKSRLKKIRNKRTAKMKKVWGWILTVLGGLSLFAEIGALSPEGLADSLIFLIPGILLLLLAKRQVGKWDRYEAIIDNRGNTSIPMIAERMGLSEKTVYSDLQKMIHSDFFIGPNYNIEAYIDAERELLVMSSGGQPLKPLPKVEPKKPEAKPEPQQWQEKEPEKEAKPKESAKPKEQAKMSDLDMIREAIARTTDDDVRGYLYGLEGSLRRINERMEKDSDLREKNSIRKLYRYYLPQIMELIRRYESPDTPAETKRQIRDALRTSANALSNIEADILEKDQLDVEVNIETLKNMFAQDGLTGRDQGFGNVKAGGSASAAASAQAGQAQQQSGGN